jgi:hypothetical protein
VKDHYLYIEAYLNKKLDSDQQADFERAMAADPDLKMAVDHYWKIEPVLDLLLEDDIQQKMQLIRSRQTRHRQIRLFIRAVAAIFILALASVWLFLNQTPSPERLFEEFYQPPLSAGTRGSEEPKASESQTMHLKAHDFIDADNLLEAEKLLQELAGSSAPERENAEWYLVLTALKAGNKDLAMVRLDALLENPAHKYYDRASQLKKRL